MGTFQAKKSLGQHFLKSANVVKKIVGAGNLAAADVVLEIGPGKGVLTAALLATSARVVAIEKDAEAVAYLQEKFAKEIKTGALTLVHDDILNTDIEPLLKASEVPTPVGSGRRPERRRYKLIANIPYYITGEIIRKFLTAKHQPERMILLVQKEVGERVVARDGKESILSLSVKAYGTPKKIMNVPAKFFSPAPKVDSVVLAINDITHEKISRDEEALFFKLIKTAFSQRRKQIRKTLAEIVPSALLAEILKENDLSENARPEEISFDVWMTFVRRLENKNQ